MAKAIGNIPETPSNTEEPAETSVRHPEIVVNLLGNDFQVLAKVGTALRKAKVAPAEISECVKELAAADRKELLATIQKWVSVQ